MGKTLMLVALMVWGGALSVMGGTQASPLGLVPEPVPGLSVSIWTDKSEYRVDDEARIYVNISQNAYVYVFNIDTVGRVRQVFPNWYSGNAYLRRGTHVIPDRPTYRLRVVEPTGVDTLQVIASLQPLSLHTGSQGDPFPLIAPDPDRGGAQIQGLVPEPGYGQFVTAWTSFRILPRLVAPVPQPTPQPCPPGWGWTPYPCPPSWSPPHVPPYGWGWYFYDGSWHLYIGTCPREARFCWHLTADGRWQMTFRLHFGN